MNGDESEASPERNSRVGVWLALGRHRGLRRRLDFQRPRTL